MLLSVSNALLLLRKEAFCAFPGVFLHLDFSFPKLYFQGLRLLAARSPEVDRKCVLDEQWSSPEHLWDKRGFCMYELCITISLHMTNWLHWTTVLCHQKVLLLSGYEVQDLMIYTHYQHGTAYLFFSDNARWANWLSLVAVTALYLVKELIDTEVTEQNWLNIKQQKCNCLHWVTLSLF